jgi:hypothetical protein
LLSQPKPMWCAVPGATAIAVGAFLPVLSWPDSNSASAVTVGSVVKKLACSSDWSRTRPSALEVHCVPSASMLSALQLFGPQMCSPSP